MKPFLDFLYHISPALVAVLGTGILVQKFFVSRANQASFIDFLIKELDELRIDSLGYWTLDCTEGEVADKEEKRARAKFLEQKMKGSIKSLSGQFEYFSARYDKKTDFRALVGEVSDACTGGDFEVATKKADSSRYMVIINAINRIKSELLRKKL